MILMDITKMNYTLLVIVNVLCKNNETENVQCTTYTRCKYNML